MRSAGGRAAGAGLREVLRAMGSAGRLVEKPRTRSLKYEHSGSFSIFKYLLPSQEAGNSYHYGGSTKFSRTSGEDKRCEENALDPDGIQRPLVRGLFITQGHGTVLQQRYLMAGGKLVQLVGLEV